MVQALPPADPMQHSRDSLTPIHSLANIFQKVPIRVLLTVPTLIQIVVVVALTGALSWWHGQQSVNRLAFQLQSEIGSRVQLKLETYLQAPRLIAQINQDAVRLNQLNLKQPSTLEQPLFAQLMQFQTVSEILLGTEQGALRAVNRRSGLRLLQLDPAVLDPASLDPAGQGQMREYHEYRLDASGQKVELLDRFAQPNLQQSPWYRAAVKAQQPVWSPIFQTIDRRDLSLNVNVPLYSAKGELLGVASSGVLLSVIDQFLEGLQISPKGIVFIVDREGQLIGTSTTGLPYQTQAGTDAQTNAQTSAQIDMQTNAQIGMQPSAFATELQQIRASDSSQPEIRQITNQIQSQLGPFAQITSSQQITFLHSGYQGADHQGAHQSYGQRNYVRIIPYHDALGLDWRIIIMIPESDFVAQVNGNTRTMLWLCLVMALLAVTTGAITSNWLAKPMQQLSQASQAIAAGDLERRVPQNVPIQEMQVTATAFNQMAEQLSLSFQQIETINAGLGLQVQAQTRQLRQALHFEDLLRRMIEKVRDSLDEAQILQTAVRELAVGLGVSGCDVALYNLENGTSTISYEHLCLELKPDQGHTIPFTNFSNLYQQLLQRQTVQFCLCEPPRRALSPSLKLTCLASPVMDNQGVLGDLWLFKPSWQGFSPQEIRLVQQIANQCAIALRQAQLYQKAQGQVEELERLHRLKDDFLNTVSHELRTPMANIRMATQLLEMSIDRLDQTELQSGLNIHRHLNILKEEGNREISLINDLLDLSRLEAGTEPYLATTINPNNWIPHVAEAFAERAMSQQQLLQLEISPNLPAFTTDISDLERILSELLNNACKYTPAGERIVIAAAVDMIFRPVACPSNCARSGRKSNGYTEAQASTGARASFWFSVSNSGIEIAPTEQDRIFDKFYRIPSSDPWKHGGTGLGLALVKGLVERLGGEIAVASGAGVTTFTVYLPLD
jgi:signal transduction histidine kinase